MTDDLVSATFRADNETTQQKFEDLRQHLRDETNDKKTGKNATLNMAVRKAWSRLQETDRMLESVRAERHHHIHDE